MRSELRESYKRIGFVLAEVYRREMSVTKATEHAVKAKKKLNKSRSDFRSAKPGSDEQKNSLTRSGRAVAVYRGRLDQTDPNGGKT